MNTRNQREIPAHSNAFHEEQLALFDAYVTNELEEDERVQVEQNLQDCQECQHLLAKISQIHQELGKLSELENTAIPAHARLHLPSILARIEQGEKRRNYAMIRHPKRAKSPFHSPDVYSPARLARKRAWVLSLSLGAAVCCIFLFVGLIVTLRNASPGGPRSVPPPTVWTTQHQSMLVQNSAGVFALKEIEIITPKEFRFYYAFRSSHRGSLHATAISSLNANQEPVPLATTVLSLGTIDEINVGVIRVQYLDRVSQTISLKITSPAEGKVSWQLTPLKQLLVEPHPEGGGFYGVSVDQKLFSEIIWSSPSVPQPASPQLSGIAFFKNAVGTRYIFLEVDFEGKIVVTTRERCIQLLSERACR